MGEENLRYGSVNHLIDAYYGSSAKAISSAFLTKQFLDENPNSKIALISINGASSSHTYKYDRQSEPFIFKALPSGAGLNREEKYKGRIVVFIAPSAVIDPQQLIKEIKYCELTPNQVIVAERACVLEPDIHPKEEAKMQGSNTLGSTQSGQSIPYILKVSRNFRWTFTNLKHSNRYQVMDYPEFPKAILSVIRNVDNPATALVEIPQGFPLSLDYSPEITKSTFRNLNPLQVMSDIGLSVDYMGNTILNIRALPIRVSNRFNVQEVVFEVVTEKEPLVTRKMRAEALGFGYDEINALIQPILNLKEGETLFVNSKGWIIYNPETYIDDEDDKLIEIKAVYHYEGTSGKFHDDMEEISWSFLSHYLGKDVHEKTTLTKLPRRIAMIKNGKAISEQVLEQAEMTLSPDKAIITFTNYWGDSEQEKIEEAFWQLKDFGIELINYQNGDSIENVHPIIF